MTSLFSDTDPGVERILVELLRLTPVTRKLEMLGEMNAAARQLALQGVRFRHPGVGDAELRRYLADLLLGPDLALAAYGPHAPEGSDASETIEVTLQTIDALAYRTGWTGPYTR